MNGVWRVRRGYRSEIPVLLIGGAHPGRGGTVRNADWRRSEWRARWFSHRSFCVSYYPIDIMIHEKCIFGLCAVPGTKLLKALEFHR